MQQTAPRDCLSASLMMPSEPSASYYRARYYDPVSGRLSNEDPLRYLSGQISFYSYVRNSPLDKVDPFGLWGIGGTLGVGFFGGIGIGGGNGGQFSVGGVWFTNGSLAGYGSGAGYASGVGGATGSYNGNLTAGFNFSFPSGGVVITNGDSAGDLAGPFRNTQIALGSLTIDIGRGSNGKFVLTFTGGVGGGVGFSQYCSNTWTKPANSSSYQSGPDHAGNKCECHGW